MLGAYILQRLYNDAAYKDLDIRYWYLFEM